MAVGGVEWLRVPVGEDAARWVTRDGCRRVLFVVHNVTSATRLLDVLPLFHSDPRVQLFATCTGSSPFLAGVPELLAGVGVPVVPWEQAKGTGFDLAVSASYGGELGLIRAKLAVLSHGVGYNKRLAAPKPHVTETKQVPDKAPVFGLSPDWLLRENGAPLATATVLSHPEQLTRLRESVPEAAGTAALAGDPCFDRILAGLPERARYRRALGVGEGQRLVVVSSTWAPRSLFGGDATAHDDLLPWLLDRLATDLPADEYRKTAVLHPNIWHGHGPGQVRAWLDNARRAGLDLVDPLEGWRQALIAADCVLGDHSSVTYYAASIGVPVLLGAFPQGDLAQDSPVAALGRTAPHLSRRGSLRDQIDRTIAEHDPARYKDLAEQTSSAPGESASLLRRLFYGLLDLPEPDTHPALLDPLPLPPYTPAQLTAPVRVFTRRGDTPAPEIEVTRHAVTGDTPDPSDDEHDAHTSVDEETRETGRLALADVVVRRAREDDPRLGPPPAWTAETLARYPYCGMAVYVDGPDRCVAGTRDGHVVRLTATPAPDGRADLCDPAAYASALYAHLLEHPHPPAELTVWTGTRAHRVNVAPYSPSSPSRS
ncbi:hypothetical protein IAG44_11775 [Streptomyces roseirectus]|uniref:Uncharacterized protein n=1 Tax=Streptomyces roseirectus TaxID=2768066 RepID=A0A7H0IB95_9ACTN|nr:hypothetical protein [Streptomyces roseirectus]QNP70061.1 hypothetical protein IAG44_11775 [Streptomyces roseirectus]